MSQNLIPAFDPESEQEVYRPSAAIDPQRLEYLWTLAERMARSTLVPESLRTKGPKNAKENLPPEEVIANVFAVVEQADRWNISPFALLSCAAIVHGKLGFEGKVISAVLKSRYGIDLEYEWSGEGENRTITITGRKPGTDKPLSITGTVKEWKTSGDGSPWRPATYDKMLVYRGAREFARIHEPAAIMGVLGDDELYAIEMDRRAQVARDVTPSLADRFGGSRSSEGFNAENVTRQIGNSGQVPMERIDNSTGEVIEQRASTQTEQKPAQQTRTTPPASDKPPSSDDAGDGGQVGNPPPHLSAETFRNFARALARMQSPENVERAKDAFWKDNGPKPEAGTRFHELGFTIFKKQIARTKGEIPADGLLDEIDAQIDEAFGGDL